MGQITPQPGVADLPQQVVPQPQPQPVGTSLGEPEENDGDADEGNTSVDNPHQVGGTEDETFADKKSEGASEPMTEGSGPY